MIQLLNLLTIFVPLVGLSHFYFAYVYHIKRKGLPITLLLFIISLFTDFCIYLLFIKMGDNHTSLVYFYLFVVFMFLLHHVYDVYKFGYKKEAFIFLFSGLTIFLSLLTNRETNNTSTILIWALVFYHYFYWIQITTKRLKGSLKKSFLKEVILVHTFFFCLLAVSSSYKSDLFTFIFSLFFFHHATLIHIIFSALKDLLQKLENKN